VELKTRYYTEGFLTARTAIWWLFPLSTGPADYTSPGRLLLWCPWEVQLGFSFQSGLHPSNF